MSIAGTKRIVRAPCDAAGGRGLEDFRLQRAVSPAATALFGVTSAMITSPMIGLRRALTRDMRTPLLLVDDLLDFLGMHLQPADIDDAGHGDP